MQPTEEPTDSAAPRPLGDVERYIDIPPPTMRHYQQEYAEMLQNVELTELASPRLSQRWGGFSYFFSPEGAQAVRPNTPRCKRRPKQSGALTDKDVLRASEALQADMPSVEVAPPRDFDRGMITLTEDLPF